MAWRGMERHDMVTGTTEFRESEEPKKLRGLSKRPNDAGQSRERRGMAWHNTEDENPRNPRSSKDRQNVPMTPVSREPEEAKAWH